MTPFHLKFTLSRRQRLRVEVVPWLPAIAGVLGFSVGAAFLATAVSPWCLFLLLLPVLIYRGLFAFAFDLIVNGGRVVEIHVDEFDMHITSGGETKVLPLDGVFQVFRSSDGDVWTVLHLDRTVLTIPANAITAEQIRYLRGFAHRNTLTRAEPQR